MNRNWYEAALVVYKLFDILWEKIFWLKCNLFSVKAVITVSASCASCVA